MARGRYPADRTQALTQIAAAVIGSAAAAQMDSAHEGYLCRPPCPTRRGGVMPASRPATAQLRTIILAALEAQGVKQIELADRIGHSEKHVSQSLTGACGLALTLAEKMLATLGLQLVVSTVPVDDPHAMGCLCGRCDADGFTDGSHAGSPRETDTEAGRPVRLASGETT